MTGSEEGSAGTRERSYRRVAIVAGISFVIMTVAALFALNGVIEPLRVHGDAATTASNIAASETRFRLGIACLVVVLVTDVVVAWALYVFLERTNARLSLLGAWLRLTYVVFLAIAILCLLIALEYAAGADYLMVLGWEERSAQAMLALDAFDSIWGAGLGVFALHLFILGYLVFRSGYVPKVLGVLLVLAGIGYLVGSLGNLLWSGYADYESVVDLAFAIPMFGGELGLAFWLLIKGNRTSVDAPS